MAQVVLFGLIFFGPRTVFVLFDFKSRREEAWLAEKFSAYADYQQRVRKLIPFIY